MLNITILRGQIKVAVLDFENTSTIKKYDGFGKAMSNMLLTDLKNNIHPRKISFLERSQLNKILNEQQLQNTKNFDKNTAVTFGKLAGVKYVILGSVYVLDGVCNLNSRMVDVESSEIIYAKESNGKITDWLNLKTKLAEELSSELNNPIQIEEEYTNVEVNEGTISQYSKVIELLENGELEKANDFLELLKSVQPDFKYFDELQSELETIKKQIQKIEQDIEVTTTDPIGAAKNFDNSGNYKEAEKYYLIGLNRLKNYQIGNYMAYNLLLAELSFKYKDYDKSVFYCDKVLDVYPLFDQAISFKTQSLLQLNKQNEFIEWSKNYLSKINEIGDNRFFYSYLKEYKTKNNIEEPNNDFTINNSYSGTGFGLNAGGLSLIQGDKNLFGGVLNYFSEINSKLYDIESTLSFLDEISSANGVLNKFESQIEQHYLPKSQYITKESSPKDKLIIAKSGNHYQGPYFENSRGQLWSKSSPNECPCLRLLTEKQYFNLNQSYIKNEYQYFIHFSKGWYSLLNMDSEKSRKSFGQIIFYLLENKMGNYNKLYEFINSSIVDLDMNKPGNGYQGLRDIINVESANYSGKEKLKFLEALCNDSVVYNSDDMCNSIINFAHTYLIEDKIDEAIKIYQQLKPDFLVKSFNLTIEQIINNDLSDFENKGIIKKGVSNKILNAL